VYGEFYRDPRIFEVAGQLKLELVSLEGGSQGTSRPA
jgi:hypothetical protein